MEGCSLLVLLTVWQWLKYPKELYVGTEFNWNVLWKSFEDIET